MDYQLLQGDNRAVLDAMPAKSIHAIITSPPYFGLRAYSGDQQVEWPTVEYAPMPGLPPINVAAMRCGLGNEPTLEAYIGHLILCLRSWRRVLRDDGCCFVNLGDSFAGSGGAGGDYNAGGIREGQPKFKPGKPKNGLKAKDLQMVPARFALAAQADGWYVRSRIIWAKGVSFLPDYAGSCMPESVEDRPTKSDEDIYLLTKRPNYYWDNEAVKEKSIYPDDNRKARQKPEDYKSMMSDTGQVRAVINPGNPKTYSSRSLRSVWVINPQGYDGAHFAVWPEKLVAPMIKAATSEHGCCAQCGAPYERVVELGGLVSSGPNRMATKPRSQNRNPESTPLQDRPIDGFGDLARREKLFTGWQATCTCAADVIPCTVCDPFNGSGTTGAVACAHNRNYIGIDLSADYIELAHERIREAINESGRAYIAPVCKTTDFVDLPLFGG